MMKVWWLNLSLKEKQLVILATCSVFFFMVYELTYVPLSQSVETLRRKIHGNQALLSWMQQSDQLIQKLAKQSSSHETKPSGSVISLIQQHINNSEFAKNVTQLQQAENDTVQLRLHQLSFDLLSTWLTTLSHDQLVITQMVITPIATKPGMVDVDLKIQLSSN